MLGKAMLDGEGPWRVERHVGKDKTLRGGVLRLLHKMAINSCKFLKSRTDLADRCGLLCFLGWIVAVDKMVGVLGDFLLTDREQSKRLWSMGLYVVQ